jgi:hypothetical protein
LFRLREALGGVQLASTLVQHRQIVSPSGHGGVVTLEQPLEHLQRVLLVLLRVGELALQLVQDPEVVQALRHVEVVALV